MAMTRKDEARSGRKAQHAKQKGGKKETKRGKTALIVARSQRRLKTLNHLKGVLGEDVVKNLGAYSSTSLEVVRKTVQKGVPSSAVAELQRELGELKVPRPSRYVEAIASRATRARRSTLTVEEGERLVRVAGVLARALDVWEDEEDAADFLVSSHPMLGGDSPIDRARSELGARQVEDLLAKLDLGLPV